MISAFARALEALFGSALTPAAWLLRASATVALLTAIVFAARAVASAILAWRYGWLTAPVVSCRECGRLAADPEDPRCPAGHPVRFPPWAAGRERRRSRRSVRTLMVGYPILLAVGVCGAALAGYRVFGVGQATRPLATIAAAAAYLFFAAALYCVAFSLSPRPHGAGNRILHVGLALACLLPAATLALTARAFEPPPQIEIGSLWTTPTALYVKSGRRAVHAAAAPSRLEAELIEARLPGFGVVWQGLKGLRADGQELLWKGSGGWTARLLGLWSGPSEARGTFLGRSVVPIPLVANRRVKILATRESVRFEAEP